VRKIVYKSGIILTIKSLSGKKTFEGFLLFAVSYRNRRARLSLRERAIRKGCSFCMMRGKPKIMNVVRNFCASERRAKLA
jgi:hypothetical protein